MWIEEKTVLLGGTNTHTHKNRMIDKNRCDIGLFCCEFLDRVIFQESDRVTACSGTSLLFLPDQRFFNSGTCVACFQDTFTVFELTFVTENERFLPADECPG